MKFDDGGKTQLEGLLRGSSEFPSSPLAYSGGLILGTDIVRIAVSSDTGKNGLRRLFAYLIF